MKTRIRSWCRSLRMLRMAQDEFRARDEETLVTVARYRDLAEAIVSRSLLESAGIQASLRDENFVRMNWTESNYIGNMRLQVPSSQAEDAKSVLEELPELEPLAEEDALHMRCPQCGSMDTHTETGRGVALGFLVFFGIPVLAGVKDRWYCTECGSMWDVTPDE